MRKVCLGLACLVTLCLGSAATSHAAPITWSLAGVTFDDLGTATGTFVYDADTNTYSNINITTTAGSAESGAAYGQPTGGNATFIDMATSLPVVVNVTQRFTMNFQAALTNAGGTVALAGGAESLCLAAGCGGGPTGQQFLRTVTAGSVTTVPPTAAPEPGTLLLLGAGAAGLIARTRRVAKRDH